MLRIGNILRLKDPRSKNWLPKTTGEYEDCCQNLQQLRQDLLLGSKGGDEIVYQSPGSITTSRDWVEFVLKSGGGALCHEALSNSETKEPRIFEVTQLKFNIRAT